MGLLKAPPRNAPNFTPPLRGSRRGKGVIASDGGSFFCGMSPHRFSFRTVGSLPRLPSTPPQGGSVSFLSSVDYMRRITQTGFSTTRYIRPVRLVACRPHVCVGRFREVGSDHRRHSGESRNDEQKGPRTGAGACLLQTLYLQDPTREAALCVRQISTNFLKIPRPSTPLFSGWNWVAKRFSR